MPPPAEAAQAPAFAAPVSPAAPAPIVAPGGAQAAQGAAVGAAAPQLPETLSLRLENHALRVRIVQMEIQAQQTALSQQRTELETAIAAAAPGWRMNWQTGALEPAAGTVPTPAPPSRGPVP